MEQHYEQHYHRLEKSHFWFKARRNFIVELLKDTSKQSKILDVGCSSGLLLTDLKSNGFLDDNLYGIDISETAIANCKKQGLQNCHLMSGDALNFNQKFDVIIASDSLEHINDDLKAVSNWKDHLTENGKICIFVPAFNMLWSQHDIENKHYRRYTKKQLIKVVSKTNLDVIRASYWNFSLFLPVLIIRKLQSISKHHKKNHQGDLKSVSLLNPILLGLLNLENYLLRFLNFPIGISTFCIAQKKSED
ncbi:MAG: class I SAM-dependent methyltransferase [Winogradskyella sp.]|nr:class I SAM-dependent methyltransferase [Winogradskyella sp.]MBT8375427.1 class I SAM-dependent methyltransferase [Bacteroidia bacterium]NNC45917.1 class I SAM-dependent methyltransferase [Winogradskyella sp.]NNF85760.1 class I SAM-dependent methyltransferase [Winogradskyella sp.]NNK39801.1 class I SAM-dependent methyltransferase [Winogradskyella sp.]